MGNGTKRLPEGVSDIHANDLEIKESLIQKLQLLYRSYGYRQVQTPIFEYYDLFLEINGTIDREKMVKLVDRDGKILVLRPDATIPIARMVATFDKKEDSYFKVSYFTNVFRMNDDKQSITNRERTQAGIELFGNNSSEADVEVITLAIQSLKRLEIVDFKIDLGQANYFKELMIRSAVSVEQEGEIRKRIEQKNVSELKQILDTTNIEAAYKEVILSMPLLYGNPTEVIQQAESLALNNKMKEELRHLEEVYNKLVEAGFEEYLSIDLGMINDLNYYTGIIFQGYIKNYGKPIVIGGRYDQLTKQFGSELPATGFGFYLDDVLDVIKKNTNQATFVNQTEAFVLFSENDRKAALRLADRLRENQLIVETDVIPIEDADVFIKELKRRGIETIITIQNQQFICVNKNDEQVVYNTSEDLLKGLLL